jgi:hypothetical protein
MTSRPSAERADALEMVASVELRPGATRALSGRAAGAHGREDDR